MPVTQNAHESARLAALKSYAILDTPPESDFDDLVRLAASLFHVPMSTVTIVDEHRQWFKAAVGLPPALRETSRDISFCTHAIAQHGPLIVEDTRKDTRFATNPFVTSDPGLGFYAGVPLRNSQDFALGTFCIMDNAPRTFSSNEVETLKILANQAMKLLDLRWQQNKLRELIHDIEQVNNELRSSEQRWKFALEGSGDGVWDWNIDTQQTFFSKRWKAMLGYTETDIVDSKEAWLALIHPEDIAAVQTRLQDYLAQNIDSYTLEHRLLCKNRSWKWVLTRGMVVERDDNGAPKRMVGTHTDISVRKQSEEIIWKQANFDTLTGLPNRSLFFYRLGEEIKRAARSHMRFAVMFLDLDGFKAVNDQYGHQAGDMVLVESANRIQAKIRQSDTLARLGGDEFVIIMPLSQHDQALDTCAQTIINTFRLPILQVDTTCRLSVSIGIAVYPEHGDAADVLISHADKAMYAAKSRGKNTWALYAD